MGSDERKPYAIVVPCDAPSFVVYEPASSVSAEEYAWRSAAIIELRAVLLSWMKKGYLVGYVRNNGQGRMFAPVWHRYDKNLKRAVPANSPGRAWRNQMVRTMLVYYFHAASFAHQVLLAEALAEEADTDE